MPRIPALLAALLALFAAPARAQSPNAINIPGTIEKIDATSITLKPDTAAAETFKLAPNLLILQAKPATLADIKANDFVASAAMRGNDGKLHSIELRIFPEAMRGLGEGQRPMNDPGSHTMTNATVTGAAAANGSNAIKVKFADGKSELIVDPGIPVTRLDVADKSLAQPGAKARVQGTRNDDGATVSRITIQ